MRHLENPIPRTGLPTFHEASPQRSLRDRDVVGRVWQKNRTTTSQLFSMAEGLRQLQQELDRLRLRKPEPFSSGWKWQSPYKELDPSKNVGKDTVVYISPLSDLVTTGLTDLDTLTIIKAVPGIWIALTSVPKKTGDGHYNVPRDPVPGAASAIPTGTPLKGDLDHPTTVHWLLIRGTAICPYG